MVHLLLFSAENNFHGCCSHFISHERIVAVSRFCSPLRIGGRNILHLLEFVIFVVNEILGRDYIGAIDAGDTIFVHVFGAYFGLTVARVLYNADHDLSSKQGASYTSDMFSMVGTVFLWMFWPSFNGGAAASGDAQQRAIINTYYSLCR